jgi:hypothetical protein
MKIIKIMLKEKTIRLEEINEILTDTLIKVTDKKISLKQAGVISKLALALSKNIANTDLKNRLEFLEQALKNRK